MPTLLQEKAHPSAEIISLGTELLIGHTINTDATFVARELQALGFALYRIHTVGDNLLRAEDLLREAVKRSRLVITTGGLGPTDDDLTKEVVARVAGRPQVLFPEALSTLKKLGKNLHWSREHSEQETRQAYFPEGSILLPNSMGTAPGCAVPTDSGTWICLLPGPPSELVPMLQKELVPFLQERFSLPPIFSHYVRLFGLGESALATQIPDLLNASDPTCATYVGGADLTLRLTTRAENPSEAKKKMAPALAAIRHRLGELVYGVDVENLEAVVVAELLRQKKCVALAESCTGGLVAKRLTDQSGASNVFGFGFVTYANAAKTKLLGVPEETLARFGAVSRETCEAMARGARREGEADFGLALTGIAGPTGGSAEKPVGLVYLGLADEERVFVRRLLPHAAFCTREGIRQRSANHAFDMLRRRLLGLPVEAGWAADEPGTKAQSAPCQA